MRNWTGKLALVWTGLILGTSFIAAPAKFQVQDLPLPLALQVGRSQFHWATIAECCLLFLVLAILIGDRSSRRSCARPELIFWGLVVLVLSAQHLALMPMLQARSQRIIDGQQVESSQLHLAYVALEGAKLLLLMSVGLKSNSDSRDSKNE